MLTHEEVMSSVATAALTSAEAAKSASALAQTVANMAMVLAENTGRYNETVMNIDRKFDLYLAAQTERCKQAECQRMDHQLILHGDGTDTNPGLVRGHAALKLEVSDLKSSMTILRGACWAVLLLVIAGVIGLAFQHLSQERQSSLKYVPYSDHLAD